MRKENGSVCVFWVNFEFELNANVHLQRQGTNFSPHFFV